MHAQRGRLLLFVSSYVLEEIRELPQKIKPKLGVTAERVDDFIRDLAKHAQATIDVPPLYNHPIDPDDSHYVNLALATRAQLIVSRDRHLLNLMERGKKRGQRFHCPIFNARRDHSRCSDSTAS
jgi:putative PIN family toxin of toxin-antitoxin system